MTSAWWVMLVISGVAAGITWGVLNYGMAKIEEYQALSRLEAMERRHHEHADRVMVMFLVCAVFGAWVACAGVLGGVVWLVAGR